MPIAFVNGARLNYVQVGVQVGAHGSADEGVEDLVMVHGLATNLAFWYLPYASVFSERYRVTIFDLRGHGRSELTAGGYTPQAQAADLEGLMDQLGIERAHFLAHSFGGVVALGLARRSPQRVSSLVLADCQVSAMRDSFGGEWSHRELIQSLLDRHGFDLDAASPQFGYDLLTCVAKRLLGGGQLPADVVELVGPTLGKLQRRTARRWLGLVAHAQDELMTDDGLTAEVLRAFDFPILGLYGARSKACAASPFFARVWPGAQFVTIPEAGHFFPSARAPEVIAACDRFWDLQAGRLAKSDVAI